MVEVKFFKMLLVMSIACLWVVSGSRLAVQHDQQQNLYVKTRDLLIREVLNVTSSPSLSALFGQPAVTPAPREDLAYGVHPRLIMNKAQWEALLDRYADPAYFHLDGSWSKNHRRFTLAKGPLHPFINDLSSLDTSLYSASTDFSLQSEMERSALQPLANYITLADEASVLSLFMCTFWAQVNERVETSEKFLPDDTFSKCAKAAVAWSHVLMVHRAYTCAGLCSTDSIAYIWDPSVRWSLSKDWRTGVGSLALYYDVSADRLSTEDARSIRSAIALAVLKQESWGTTEASTMSSPNAQLHPHRIFSNWATYHANLYLANLVLEGETYFDAYATAVLTNEGKIGFDAALDARFNAVYDAYMRHSVYPDGSTFEDAYTYFVALREGSLGFVAVHRRGVNILETDRFRSFILNVAHMTEPWHCGSVIGHASGGGIGYPPYAALFRYVYPQSPISGTIWKQRMGAKFLDNNPCRINWYQNMMQMTLLAGEHDISVVGESLQELPLDVQSGVSKSFYAPRRGLLITRNGFLEEDTYVHFDARPDAFFPGHDNADRGIFTFTTCRQTWITDFPVWHYNVDSRKHSLMHVDGMAEHNKAPSVKMVKVYDNGNYVVAVANLTYAYNVHWAASWTDTNAPSRGILSYDDGMETTIPTLFTVREFGKPTDFGWPDGDDGADIGFTRPEARMFGDADLGFMGMYAWKRNYREEAEVPRDPLKWAFRSIALIRSETNSGYLVVADSFAVAGESADHTFESYIMLHDDVDVDQSNSHCGTGWCFIKLFLADTSLLYPKQVDMVAYAQSQVISFRTETFTSDIAHRRLIFKTSGVASESMIIIMHGYEESSPQFAVTKLGTGRLEVKYAEDTKELEIDEISHELIIKATPIPSVMPTTTPSIVASPSAGESVVPSPSYSPLESPTVQPSFFPSPSESFSVAPVSPTPSPSMVLLAPMSAIPITTKFWETVKNISSDPSIFYFATSKTHQVVFKTAVISEQSSSQPSDTNGKGKKTTSGSEQTRTRGRTGVYEEETEIQEVDTSVLYRLTTCSQQTNAETEVTVWDCGDSGTSDNTYHRRRCALVYESGRSDLCGSFKTEMDRPLEPGQQYYIVVSANLLEVADTKKASNSVDVSFKYHPAVRNI